MTTVVKVSWEVAERIERNAMLRESKDQTIRRLLLGELPAPKSRGRDPWGTVIKVSRATRMYLRRKALPKETVGATLLRLLGGEEI